MRQPIRRLVTAVLILALPACSTVRGWFPDKQKEYRYSTEIPPLEIPPDLLGSAAFQDPVSEPPATARSEARESAPPATGGGPAPHSFSLPSGMAVPEGVEQTAQIIRQGDNAHIQIETSFAHAWTLTEKAINRLGIEIKDRDRSKKLFFVYYASGVSGSPARGFLADLRYLFTGRIRAGSEQEYRIELEDVAGLMARIRVSYTQDARQNADEALHLLDALNNQIRILAQGPDSGTDHSP